jgi:hypothetical protein
LPCQSSHSARVTGFYLSMYNERNITHAVRFAVTLSLTFCCQDRILYWKHTKTISFKSERRTVVVPVYVVGVQQKMQVCWNRPESTCTDDLWVLEPFFGQLFRNTRSYRPTNFSILEGEHNYEDNYNDNNTGFRPTGL